MDRIVDCSGIAIIKSLRGRIKGVECKGRDPVDLVLWVHATPDLTPEECRTLPRGCTQKEKYVAVTVKDVDIDKFDRDTPSVYNVPVGRVEKFGKTVPLHMLFGKTKGSQDASNNALVTVSALQQGDGSLYLRSLRIEEYPPSFYSWE